MKHFEPGHYGHFERAFPRLTPGVKLLLALNLAGFVIKNIGFNLILGTKISYWVGLSAANLLDGFGLGLARLVTYQFFHSVDIGHLLWNMVFLYFFGTLAEGRMDEGFERSYLRRGRVGIVTLYLASGVAGGLVYIALSLLMGARNVPVIGASGSVYGIMVYAACMFPRRQIPMIFIQPEMRYFVGFLVFIGVYWQLFELKGLRSSGVADSAHIGGALWGFLAYRIAERGGVPSGRNPVAWLQKKRAASAARAEQRQQEALDQILDKVHREGMSALTPAERRFLDRMSKRTRR